MNKHFNLETIFRLIHTKHKFKKRPPQGLEILNTFEEKDYFSALAAVANMNFETKTLIKEVYLYTDNGERYLALGRRKKVVSDDESEERTYGKGVRNSRGLRE